MSKLPWMKHYPTDEMADVGVCSLSLPAFGLWRKMLNFMWTSDRRGYLSLAGKPLPTVVLSRMAGASVDEVEGLLRELGSAAIYSVEHGTIFSRRMVNDSIAFEKASVAGKKGGGNPTFKGSHKGKHKGRAKVSLTSDSDSFAVQERGAGENKPNLGQMCLEIYDAYPRKVGRAAAVKAIIKAITEGHNPAVILQQVQKYADAVAGHPDPQFIPHPATWFNQHRWEDDPAEWRRWRLSAKQDDDDEGEIERMHRITARQNANANHQA